MPDPDYVPPALAPGDFGTAGRLIEAAADYGPGSDPAAVAAVVLLIGLLRRLDALAASMAETVAGATSGGLLGLLTGRRG